MWPRKYCPWKGEDIKTFQCWKTTPMPWLILESGNHFLDEVPKWAITFQMEVFLRCIHLLQCVSSAVIGFGRKKWLNESFVRSTEQEIHFTQYHMCHPGKQRKSDFLRCLCLSTTRSSRSLISFKSVKRIPYILLFLYILNRSVSGIFPLSMKKTSDPTPSMENAIISFHFCYPFPYFKFLKLNLCFIVRFSRLIWTGRLAKFLPGWESKN